MKTYRKLIGGLLALALIAVPAIAQAQFYYWWQVIDGRGRPYPSQAVRCSVFDWPTISHSTAAGIGGNKVLHQDATLNNAGSAPGSTMPLLSDANSRFHFWSSGASTQQIKVLCYYDRGGAATDALLDRTVHQVMIDRDGRKVVRFQIASNAGTPTRTGVWFGPGDVIRDVLVNLTSGPYGSGQANTPVGSSPGTPHLNVGFGGAHSYTSLGILGNGQVATGGGANAFCTDCSPMTSVLIHSMGLTSDSGRTRVEWIRPHVQAAGFVSNGSTLANPNVLHITSSHRGVALAMWRSGGPANGVGAGGTQLTGSSVGVTHSGAYIEVPFAVPTDLEVTYTTSTVPGLSGHVYIFFDQMHTGSAYGPASQFTTVP